jgi:aryl-phospho-beta-D-glucosidase BglC (GH1 family)
MSLPDNYSRLTREKKMVAVVNELLSLGFPVADDWHGVPKLEVSKIWYHAVEEFNAAT